MVTAVQNGAIYHVTNTRDAIRAFVWKTSHPNSQAIRARIYAKPTLINVIRLTMVKRGYVSVPTSTGTAARNGQVSPPARQDKHAQLVNAPAQINAHPVQKNVLAQTTPYEHVKTQIWTAALNGPKRSYATEHAGMVHVNVITSAIQMPPSVVATDIKDVRQTPTVAAYGLPSSHVNTDVKTVNANHRKS